MKQVFFILATLLVLSATSTANAKDDKKGKKKTETAYFQSNMHCTSCEAKVEEKLRFEKGMKDLKIDAHTNTIKLEYSNSKTNSTHLKEVIEGMGYEAKIINKDEYEKLQDHENHEHSPQESGNCK
ncbi:MAG: heavy-metal-associated domain-containing protein [Bacteroidales bacterium]